MLDAARECSRCPDRAILGTTVAEPALGEVSALEYTFLRTASVSLSQ